MREAERPPGERVSVLDRSEVDADRRAVASRPSLMRLAEERLQRVRLAVEVGDCIVLIGEGNDDHLYLMVSYHGGGAACGSFRWVLRERGAIVLNSSNDRRVFVSGIVADEVTAVRVGAVPAHLQDNAFLAEIGRDDSPVPVITTAEGEREVGRPAP
jgi:hypothetical protein